MILGAALLVVVGCSPGASISQAPSSPGVLEYELAAEDGDAAEAAEFAAVIDRLQRCFGTEAADGHPITREEQAFVFYYPWANGGKQGKLLDFARQVADSAEASGCAASSNR